jgi:hypothetical protein
LPHEQFERVFGQIRQVGVAHPWFGPAGPGGLERRGVDPAQAFVGGFDGRAALASFVVGCTAVVFVELVLQRGQGRLGAGVRLGNGCQVLVDQWRGGVRVFCQIMVDGGLCVSLGAQPLRWEWALRAKFLPPL